MLCIYLTIYYQSNSGVGCALRHITLYTMPTNNSQIIIYQTENGQTKLEVRLENETVWLTQKLMAELFQTTPQNITIHLKNIFEEGELSEVATCKDFLQVQKEGERTVERNQKFYNLDAIISVGYRKPWKYFLIPHNKVAKNNSFKGIIAENIR